MHKADKSGRGGRLPAAVEPGAQPRMRRPGLWILLADAGWARVIRSPERSDGMNHAPLQTVFEASTEHRPLAEIMADAPGRTFASSGVRRSAMEYRSDPVRDEMRRFAASLLADIEVRFLAGEFDQLVICAPPRMLNALRESMPDGLASIVRSEIAKDLTKLAELELRQALRRISLALD